MFASRTRRTEKAIKSLEDGLAKRIAEQLVKMMKENYIALMPKPDLRTVLQNRAAALTHYNEHHPHCAQGYHSPIDYRRQQASLT
ncbi:TPA: transposase [Enterobacter cloacae]|nr:transposase [Enterobacter cloacae]